MNKRSKECDISPKVKKRVWDRDGGRCVICGRKNAMPTCHYVSRAQGGLGIEENIVTLCQDCHFELDNTTRRNGYKKFLAKYLSMFYRDWSEEKLYFRTKNER